MKEFLVHLDGGERAGLRLEVAIDLAKRFGARLTGLFAQAESNAPSVVARRASDGLNAAADRISAQFHKALADAGVSGQWMRLSHGEPGFVVAETAFCARYADMAILGQWEQETSRVPEDLAEEVILQSGRPVLVVPYAGEVASIGNSITIAWNASREAARAIHDALPFLKGAREVTVLAVREPDAPAPAADLPQVNIIEHLAAHGVRAKVERLVDEEIGVMDVLLSRAFDLGSDLLVMGAHSGSGLRRGSGTRFILHHMTLPVLMSN